MFIKLTINHNESVVGALARTLDGCINEQDGSIDGLSIEADTIICGLDDADTINIRKEFNERFKRSYMATLEPLSENDEDEVECHVGDLLWAADAVTDILGKKQLQDILWHLFSSEEYWKQ